MPNLKLPDDETLVHFWWINLPKMDRWWINLSKMDQSFVGSPPQFRWHRGRYFEQNLHHIDSELSLYLELKYNYTYESVYQIQLYLKYTRAIVVVLRIQRKYNALVVFSLYFRCIFPFPAAVVRSVGRISML